MGSVVSFFFSFLLPRLLLGGNLRSTGFWDLISEKIRKRLAHGRKLLVGWIWLWSNWCLMAFLCTIFPYLELLVWFVNACRSLWEIFFGKWCGESILNEIKRMNSFGLCFHISNWEMMEVASFLSLLLDEWNFRAKRRDVCVWSPNSWMSEGFLVNPFLDCC